MLTAVRIGVVAVSLIACSCDLCGGTPAPRPGYPIKSIDGTVGPEGVSFSFGNCQNQAQKLPVDKVTVRRVDDSAEAKAVCEVGVDPKRIEFTNLTKWTYGSVPEGWSTSGCSPLRSGQYVVFAGGAGSGVRKFSIDDAGTLKWLDGPCN